jgi:hypothetical protein
LWKEVPLLVSAAFRRDDEISNVFWNAIPGQDDALARFALFGECGLCARLERAKFIFDAWANDERFAPAQNFFHVISADAECARELAICPF